MRDRMKAPVKITSWRGRTFEVETTVLWDGGQLKLGGGSLAVQEELEAQLFERS